MLMASIAAVAAVTAVMAQTLDADEAKRWSFLNRAIDARFPGVSDLSTADLAAHLRDRDHPPALLVDVRERAEYAVSHLPDAVWAGTEKTQANLLNETAPGRPVVFHCSVGWRSAQAAERALKAGRSGIFNLRGSIFQWANEGRSLVDRRGEPTKWVHPYNDTWGQLLDRRLWSREPSPQN